MLNVIYLFHTIFVTHTIQFNCFLRYDEAIVRITKHVFGAGKLSAMHLLSCLVLLRIIKDPQFLTSATLGDASLNHIHNLLFEGEPLVPSRCLCSLQACSRRLGVEESHGENITCEAFKPEDRVTYDVFQWNQTWYSLDESWEPLELPRHGGDPFVSAQVRLTRLKSIDSLELEEKVASWTLEEYNLWKSYNSP